MTGELLERVGRNDFRCVVCGGQSSTRLPRHEPDCLVTRRGKTAIVYNRPAKIERVYETVVRVRYEDNNSTGYVPHDAVEVNDG